jgi:hypothetical protein
MRDSPSLEGQVPVYISLRNRVAQIYSQALGSIFVALYDSQGYDLHTGALTDPELIAPTALVITFRYGYIENTVLLLLLA